MQDRLVDIQRPSGAMETFVTHPREGGPFPLVVVCMDVWGLREEKHASNRDWEIIFAIFRHRLR